MKLFRHLKDLISHPVTKGALDGAKKLGEKGTEVGKDTLNLIMRKSTDDLVREHILQQGRYNDAFANRLDEALRRIAELEKRINRE